MVIAVAVLIGSFVNCLGSFEFSELSARAGKLINARLPSVLWWA